jgi:threonine aldolase
VSDDSVIDFRSDTVTKPTPAMRQAMAQAEVGDDVFGDDPTVNRLQERVAELLGKEAALLVPTGTMANQTVIRSQTQPGDEIIAHSGSHIYQYESGGPAAISGCMLRLLEGDRGIFTAETLRRAIKKPNPHFPNPALVVVENTHNRGGGSVWPLDQVAEVTEVARDAGLKLHLDGARLMNACVAKACSPVVYAKHFDTVSICFSKGLGAPVGSAVAGDAETIHRVHRFRKMFGGGMRQAGILAAAALHALDHHVDRLTEDHANARHLAEQLSSLPGITIDVSSVETNIVFFRAGDSPESAESFCRAMYEEGVWMLPEGDGRVRALTHLDVSRGDVDRAVEIIRRTMPATTAA